MSKRIERCDKCKWWDCWDDREPPEVPASQELVIVFPKLAGTLILNNDYSGFCKRFPPTFYPNPDDEDELCGWPDTNGNDFCGEFEANRKAQRHRT